MMSPTTSRKSATRDMQKTGVLLICVVFALSIPASAQPRLIHFNFSSGSADNGKHVGAEGGTPGLPLGRFIVVNPSMSGAQLASAINNLALTGGVVYFVGAGSTYACPPFPPSNVAYVTLGPDANAEVFSLGFDGIASGIITQVALECPGGWSGDKVYNTKLSGGITIDFQNAGTGVILQDSQKNDWSDFTLANCGQTTTPCLQLLSGGGGSPSYNSAFNRFSNYLINPNTSPGQYATAVYVSGSNAGGGSVATDNKFEHGLIAGNILCGFEFEENTDSNVIEDTQMFEQSNSLSNSASVCVNLLNAASDVDADGIRFADLFVTGNFAYPFILGQSSSNVIDNTNQVYQNLHVIGGTPLISVKSNQLNSGNGPDTYENGRIAVAANADVVPPSTFTTFKAGDAMFARTANSGCIFFGSPGSGPMLCGGRGAPTMNCVTGSQYYRIDGSGSTLRYSCESTNAWTAVGP